MIVSSHAKKTHFHKRGFARGLGPKKRVLELRKFSVLFITLTRLNLLSSLVKITCLFGKKKKQTKNVLLANRQPSIFIVLSSVSVEVSWRIVRARKGKTNGATMTSFSWPVLLSSIALHQSAREKSLSYLESESRNFLAEMKSMNVGNFFWLSFACCVLHLLTPLKHS